VKPSIGRLVHYSSLGDRDGKYPPEAQAALITRVHSRSADIAGDLEEEKYVVSLRVFFEDGDFTMKGVLFTTAKAGTEEARGKWSWPERL
jgi:hypothetical protein